MRERHTARDLGRLNTPSGEGLVDRAESERLIREQPFADSLPPYGDFHVVGNTLWVVDPSVPGDTAWSATAFRRDGAIIGRLHGRGRGTPVAFAPDRVAVRDTDADGGVSVRVHRIIPVR
jgi:hypothetical protein